jgi:hypothetical protein
MTTTYAVTRHTSDGRIAYGIDTVIAVPIDDTRCELLSQSGYIGELFTPAGSSNVQALAYDQDRNATNRVGTFRNLLNAVQALADEADGWRPGPCQGCGAQHRWNKRVGGVWACQFHAS